MKDTIKRIREYIGSKDNKTKIYFGFYFIFFILLLIVITINNTSNNKECPKQNTTTTVATTSNYSYRYEIDTNTTTTVLSGSRYGNETTIDKRIDDVITKYYVYYDDVYVLNKDNKWEAFNGEIVEGFDKNLINTNYINDVLRNATQKSKTSKKIVFESESGNIKITAYYDGSTVDSIELIEGDTTVKISYFDIGKIKQSDVSNDELNIETTPKDNS